MIENWIFRLKGGAWDGAEIEVDPAAFPDEAPPVRVYLYKCGPRCQTGHLEFELDHCPLHTVAVYNRESMNAVKRTALYVYGDAPSENAAQPERELAGVGVGWSQSDDALREALTGQMVPG